MPNIKIINDRNEIPRNDRWTPAIKFNSKNRLVDEKGNRVNSDYKGRRYRIIQKLERKFSSLERLGRGFLGIITAIRTLSLFSKEVSRLFTKSKENIRFAVNEPTEEEIKTSAAPILQSACRGLIARVSLKTLQNEQLLKRQGEAATILQNRYRTHLAQSQLKALKEENKQKKLEAELKARESKRVEQRTLKFSEHTAEVFFSGRRKESFPLQSDNDVESMVKKIAEDIYEKHETLSVYFEGWFISDETRKKHMEQYQKASSATHLEFSMPANSSYLLVKAKPISKEKLGNGETRCTFANGITETFILENTICERSRGTRVFPDGKQEKGYFDRRGEFCSGYRIGADKQLEFYKPESFVSCESSSEENSFEICECEDKLIVLEKKNYTFTPSDVSVIEVLKKASARPEFGDGKSISKILTHKDFKNSLNEFIDFALGTDASETPRLFGFSDAAIMDVLEVGSKYKDIDPLKIIDPKSKRNIFLQAVHWEKTKLLKKLTGVFSHAFDAIGQDVVAEYLRCGHQGLIDSDKFKKINENSSFYYDFLEKAKLDAFHSMWLQIAKGIKPTESFREEFALLPTDKKRTLYDAAYTYNNPFIHEPANNPVKADQYSINLIWINKSKIPANQEFLFGAGNSPEQQKIDFQKKFIKPVAKWAKANPGSQINIWIDGEMTNADAVERSNQALKQALEGSVHGVVHFRDVRSIEVVRQNPAVFSEQMPIYFRVDLLKAIAADHILRNKETKYFVYGDIDMKSLSGQQLFDKKTVNFLDDFGFVLAKGGHLGFENGFFILNGDNAHCMSSHRKVIIDLSVEMALERPRAIKELQIYDTYPAMITHFLDAKSNVQKNKTPEDKLFLFRYDKFGSSAHYILPLGDEKVELRNIMPTKPVRLPPSHF